MGAIDIIILLFLIVITLKQLKRIKELIIPTRKSYVEIITVLLCIMVFMYIMYSYANIWIHYIIGILSIFMFLSMWLKQGIFEKGFISMYKYKEIILWNEIEKVIIISSKDMKVELLGGFMEQTFRFKKSDYDRVLNLIRENLPEQAKLRLKQ